MFSKVDAASGAGFKIMAAGAATSVGSGGVGKFGEQMTGDPALAEQVISLADIGIWVGIAVGVLGYITQLYFQLRRDRREQRALEAALIRQDEDCDDHGTPA